MATIWMAGSSLKWMDVSHQGSRANSLWVLSHTKDCQDGQIPSELFICSISEPGSSRQTDGIAWSECDALCIAISWQSVNGVIWLCILHDAMSNALDGVIGVHRLYISYHVKTVWFRLTCHHINIWSYLLGAGLKPSADVCWRRHSQTPCCSDMWWVDGAVRKAALWMCLNLTLLNKSQNVCDVNKWRSYVLNKMPFIDIDCTVSERFAFCTVSVADTINRSECDVVSETARCRASSNTESSIVLIMITLTETEATRRDVETLSLFACWTVESCQFLVSTLKLLSAWCGTETEGVSVRWNRVSMCPHHEFLRNSVWCTNRQKVVILLGITFLLILGVHCMNTESYTYPILTKLTYPILTAKPRASYDCFSCLRRRCNSQIEGVYEHRKTVYVCHRREGLTEMLWEVTVWDGEVAPGHAKIGQPYVYYLNTSLNKIIHLNIL